MLKFLKDWFLLELILVALLGSFIYGWYYDGSHPVGGLGWDDQTNYTDTVNRLASGNLPTSHDLHFSIGYPLMGVIGHFFTPNDPFMLISLSLLLGAAIFSFLAAKKLFGSALAFLFCLLLFYWDFTARSFNFSSELFAVPWDNQVFFFTIAFFFWLFTNRLHSIPSLKLLTVTSIIGGFCILSREETAIFIIPLLSIYLYVTKSGWKRWLFAYSLIAICYLPQILIKLVVSGSITASHRSRTYLEILSSYFQLHLLHTNTWSTVIYSNHYLVHGSGSLPQPYFHHSADRQALLQAAPWLWAAPVGISIILFMKKFPSGVKIFLVVSCAIILFYLSGPNMSAQKLKFNCLRYIAPGFIALNLATVAVAREIFEQSYSGFRRQKHKVKPPHNKYLRSHPPAV